MQDDDRLREIREAFENTAVDATRRDYLRASAGVGAALALPGAAVRGLAQQDGATPPTVPERYEFVYQHTPADETIPTLIEFADADGLDDLEALEVETVTTTEPTPAAYADLPPETVGRVLGEGVEEGESPPIPAATRLRYSPGSNPFWLLDHYPDGVFPAPAESTGFISYEQAVDGLRHLEERHPDRLSVSSVGTSPGWYNVMEFEVAPQKLMLAEVTNDVDDEAALAEKEKVLYSLAIHGDERAGAETGSRVVESVLEGENERLESLLDDVVLVFLYPNPDGWVARSPEYFSGDRTTDTDLVRVDAFRRVTGTLRDMNRQWPTIGYIDPTHYPAEPNGADLTDDDPGIDDDVPVQYEKYVPGSLDVAEFLRGYDNLNYGADLHGMFDSEEFVLGLLMNTEYGYEELHRLYELNRQLEESLNERVGPLLKENRAALEEWAADVEEWYAEFGFDDYEAAVPTEPFSYGTIYDTISYTTTGTFGSWFAQPEELGGLDLVTMSPEMALDNRVGERMAFSPGVVETQVAAYESFIETMAVQASREITASVDTGGARTAYVTTDALRRTSESLSFVDAETDERTVTLTVPPEGSQSLTATATADTGTLRIGLDGESGTLAAASLVDPAGETARTYSPAGTRGPTGTVWTVDDPDEGEWTVEVTNEGGSAPARTEVALATVELDGEGSPDPEAALGYEQRPYEVTPFEFFEQFAERTDREGSVVPVTVDDVAGGALLSDGAPAFENVVVIHDEAADDEAYVSALRAYAEAGGSLTLTDTGVRHVPALGVGTDVSADDVTDETFVVPYLGEKNLGHPLLADVRPIQRELWKVAPLGYTIGDAAPMTLLDPGAFADDADTVAATTEELVSAGTFCTGGGEGRVNVVGSLLRPATQENLHPFGLHDYSVSFLGQTVFANALGYTQRRVLDDGEVITFGSDGDGGSNAEAADGDGGS